MSSTWTRTGNLPWIETDDPTAFNTAEADYGVDFDGDGDVSLIELETNGLKLKKDLSGKLYADDQPLYMSGTTQLTETYFAAYTPVAVEDFGAGDKRFVLKHSTGSLLTFSMSSTWTRTGNLPWIETDDPTAFNTAERDYGVDFDNDGNTGLIFTPIETAGSTALRRDQSGRLYAGSQPIYLSGTTQLTETYFAAYTPVAVEDFGDGDKRLLLEHSTGSLLTFSMSSTWTRTGNLPWIEVDDSVAFNAAEAEYGLDFDGDA
jgi:DNA-directed RNA polymerase subunit H (RpoH/RPB5)